MRKHLRYRLMVFMLILVILVEVFVGVMLFGNIMLNYNRAFYQEMEDLRMWIEYFEVNANSIDDLIDFLASQDAINPLTTDRNYYVLQNETMYHSNGDMGAFKVTDNLRNVMRGGVHEEASILEETLDFAWHIKSLDCTLYVVDTRAELMDTIEDYFWLFLQALAIGIVLAVALSYFFTRQFLTPLRKLTDSVQSMRFGVDFTPLETKSKDEVGQLTRVYNEMGVRIEQNFRMLQDLLRNIPKPLFAVNGNGVVVHSNAAFKLIFDKLPERELFFAHKDESRFMLQYENRYYCVYRSLFLLEDGSEGFLFLLDDITESEALERDRKQFVANVSHEMKTPLTVIKSYSETLQEMEGDPATAKRFLQVIERSADQMNEMVSQLLELSKTEQARGGHREPLDLVAAANEVLEAMSIEMEKKELAVVTEVPQAREYICEPDKVRRVMVNLLSNSVKYSNPGGTITVTIKETEGGVLFSVKDEGIGIEKKHLPHLFDKFYRVDKARSRETGGTGLGLSIVHAIMTGMGGEVSVESTFGKGSQFTCYFPD
ncbi:MAG: HAMP domain-containing protein [Clostridia bacterium]|nr:HAMP domain-containing protein [Clostridia bacterium]